jgi:hypothetical protein
MDDGRHSHQEGEENRCTLTRVHTFGDGVSLKQIWKGEAKKQNYLR